jgi:hypothetical protein
MIEGEEDWRITCHEAGHAIVACRLGLLFERISRGDGDRGSVTVGVDNPRENPNREWSVIEISNWQKFYAGGAAAERVMFGSHREYGSKSDFIIHTDLENKWRQRPFGGWEQDIQESMTILDKNSIENVANVLLLARERSGTFRRGELSPEHVCRILKCPIPDY